MEQTQTPEQASPKTSFRTILDRSAEPFAIFSVSLFVLLVLAQFIVLPLFNRFEVDGQALKPHELAQYKAQLTRDVDEAESMRNLLVLPVKNETYRLLQSEKETMPAFASLRSSIEDVARATQGSGSILFEHFDVQGDTVSVTGDVRAGVSSMTVLAAFIEQIESLPFIDTFARPAFSREEDETIGAHSPFEFSFTAK